MFISQKMLGNILYVISPYQSVNSKYKKILSQKFEIKRENLQKKDKKMVDNRNYL